MFDWMSPKSDIDFMGLRRYFFGGSAIVMLATVVALFTPGLRLGTDFVGGTEIEVAFAQPVGVGDVREAVAAAGFESPDVVHIDDEHQPHHMMIRVREVSTLDQAQRDAITAQLCLVDEHGNVADEAACPPERRASEVKFSPGGDKVMVRFIDSPCGPSVAGNACPVRDDIKALLSGNVSGVEKRPGDNNPVVQDPRDHRVEFYFKSRGDQLMDALEAAFPEATPDQPLRVEWIGAKAGKDLRDAAIKSIVLSLIVIMLYVAFRFDIRFAPGGVICLFHDVMVALLALVITQREVTLSTVAALLTIVGYSINDTVVIYDRIRENLGRHRNMSFPKVINRSVTETLGRTIKTTITTALSLTPFLVWGTTTIKDFAFTMLVGMISGVYSTVFIASPITEIIDRKVFAKTIKKKKRRRRRKGAPASSAEAPASP